VENLFKSFSTQIYTFSCVFDILQIKVMMNTENHSQTKYF